MNHAAAGQVPVPPDLQAVLLAWLAIVLAARAVGALFARIRQPAVVGEILAGILLGPTLLGSVWPAASATLFPARVEPHLTLLAQLGVVLFMFLVGLELSTAELRGHTRVTLGVATASIVAPFALGCLLASQLWQRYSGPGVSFTAFVLFQGVSMSVTAFPVLARILADRGYQRNRVGAMALACAALNDVAAWCLLAGVVGVVQARLSGVWWTLGMTALFCLAMATAGKALAVWFARREEQQDRPLRSMAVAGAALLLCSLATEAIGIHALFGAFLCGAVIPHRSAVARRLRERLHDFTVVLLLPVFFALTGLRTSVDLIRGEHWWTCTAILAVACAGKVGGTAIAARLGGIPWRESAVLGALMNTRGLMELIVLNVGLELGVISPTLFAMLVMMAVATTFATTPLLDWITRGGKGLPASSGGTLLAGDHPSATRT